MGRNHSRGYLVPLLFLAAVVALTINCGGGGGGGGSAALSAAGTGTVAVYLKDSPADDYEHIYIWITEVSLIPARDEGGPVILYRYPAGKRFDLLALADDDGYLFTVNRNVPAVQYAKIRLGVSKIEAVAKEGSNPPCDGMDLIKLPSGKIDLNPREPFTVTKGGTLSILLDIDCDKSINLHPTGSGKCIFRPVVFVDIREGYPAPAGCPRILSGSIFSLIKENGNTTGFVLNAGDGRGFVEIALTGESRIFGVDGTFTDPAALKVGDPVHVRGDLNESGVFEASYVVIGEVLRVIGSVVTPVGAPNGMEYVTFDFDPYEGQALLRSSYITVVYPETLILWDCREPLKSDAIQPGMRARVFAKLDRDSRLLAAAIYLDVVGEITALAPAPAGGWNATIRDTKTGAAAVPVFIPEWTPIHLEGDGPLSGDFLCLGRRVRVSLDPSAPSGSLEARSVSVEAEMGEGTVQTINYFTKTMTVNLSGGGTQTVVIRDGAKIFRLGSGSQDCVGVNDIGAGDSVVYYGVRECSGTNFIAQVILIVN